MAATFIAGFAEDTAAAVVTERAGTQTFTKAKENGSDFCATFNQAVKTFTESSKEGSDKAYAGFSAHFVFPSEE